jgi:hypothetical protein
MSNNFIIMSKLRQILNLYSQNHSKLYIAITVGASRNTVCNYNRAFEAWGKTPEDVNSLSDKEWDELFKRQHQVQNEEQFKRLYAYFPHSETRLV